MATTIKSTQLDFDTIKTSLKDYLKAKTEFSDYNFEGSGLNNILDVLAYNTHLNGLIANFSLNESFLNTAQLRSSVVSHAETLGYVPKSYTSSSAFVNLSISIPLVSRPSIITLPAEFKFTSSVDGISYTFLTTESYLATDSTPSSGTGTYEFKTTEGSSNIPVKEGSYKTKTFYIGETNDQQIYVLPDITMDITSLIVKVYDNPSSSTFETYTNLTDAVRIIPTSTHYQVKEVPNGYFELLFGDGISTGKSPSAGNKITIQYISTKGTVANGGTTFTPDSTLSVDGNPYTVNASTVSESSGGAYKEDIEAIRQNASIIFASQQRLVSAEDYKAQINAKYGTYFDDVMAWGGQDHDPPQFGKVYVGLKFKAGTTDETVIAVKGLIKDVLAANLAIMSVDPEFVDPVTTKLELAVTFNFDPDLTGNTVASTQASILSAVKSYFDTNLGTFNSTFRRSLLTAQIDDLDASILNSKISVKMNSSFTPTLNTSLAYTINFPAVIADPDDENYRVTSTSFTHDSKICFIQNMLTSNKLQIVDASDNSVVIDNIGSYNTVKGTVDLVGFKPSAFSGTGIDITAVPANESTIRPLRNHILELDEDKTTISSIIDYQNTATSL